MFSPNRISTAIEVLRPRVEALEADKRANLDKSLAVDAEEHFAYQTEQSYAHASGKLTADECQVIYVALGEVGSSANGGWSGSADLPTKVVVTKVIGELLGARIGARS